MKQSNTVINGISTAIQTIITGITYFLVYRVIIINNGAEMLGVWSVVLSIAAFSNLAGSGFSTSTTKFIATYQKNPITFASQSVNAIQTSLYSSLPLILSISAILYYLSSPILSFFLKGNLLVVAISILPFTLINFILNTLSSILLSSLDGMLLYKQRNILQIISNLIFGILVFFFSINGIEWVVYSQLIQGIILFLGAILLIKLNLKTFIFLKPGFNSLLLKELLNYGVFIQGISILNLFIDPIVKFLITYYNGPSIVGYYEMASKFVIQIRNSLVMPSQVLIPISAQQNEDKVSQILTYKKAQSMLFFISFPLFFSIILFSPYISQFWIGDVNTIFIFSLCIISAAWFINTMSVPAYFFFMGIGKPYYNIYMHLIHLSFTILFSLYFGVIYNTEGVIIAWALALIIGSLTTIFIFHKCFGIEYDIHEKLYVVLMAFLQFSCVYILYTVDFKGDYILFSFFVSVLSFIILWWYFNRNKPQYFYVMSIIKNILNVKTHLKTYSKK